MSHLDHNIQLQSLGSAGAEGWDVPFERGQQDLERAPASPSSDDANEMAPEFGQSIFEQVVSHASSDSDAPVPPPDGGWRAWCVVLSSHLVYMNTWGWVNSFGVFQAYYTQLLSLPASKISWIGSVSVFLLFFVGALTGRLVDAGYFRWVFGVGIILQVSGIMFTSICTEYWHFLAAQGVVVGLGHSCVFTPVLAVLSTYFAKRRALAMGVAACGSPVGGMVFPSLVRVLLLKVGFAWTLRITGFVQLVTLTIALILAKPRIKPRRSAYSRTAIEPPFAFTESLDLLMILNGVGVIGRLFSNWVADHIGAINVFAPHALVASILLYFWMAVSDKPGLYAWSVIYGIIAAAIQSLFPTGVSLLTEDLSKIGVRMGMAFTIASFATLTGPPIAGAIIDHENGYKGAQAFAGTVLALGAGFLIVAKKRRMRRTGTGWMGKI
ncbi:hypothetical protein ACHAPJ_008885 [Fusarium lateritium]